VVRFRALIAHNPSRAEGGISFLYNSSVRILLLNEYFPPDTAATAKAAAVFVDRLSEVADVTVVCGRPSYDPTERRPWRLWQTERIGRATVIRVGSTDYSRVRMSRRGLNYLTYVALSVPRSLFVSCDAVLSMTDPPFEGIVAAFVAMLKRKPFIYNIQDMYPDMAVGGSIVPPGKIAKLWEHLHRWALRHAARVIVIGEDMQSRVVAKNVNPERVVVVRQGAEAPGPDAPQPILDPALIKTIRGEFRFTLLHAGNLGFYGAWDTMIGAARELASDGVGLVFVGDGAQRERLEAAAKDVANVRFLPFFPASKIPSVLAAADAHVITVKRGLEGVVVPSKLYGIMAAGKPIVVVASEGIDAALLGTRHGFAAIADPSNPEELVRVTRELMSDPARLAVMGQVAQAAAAFYSRSAELDKFVRTVTDAVEARS
jgi:glycosyltransferase involved in cell wall biosynthesis